MPHIYFLIEFSLLYIIRDICVYSVDDSFHFVILHTADRARLSISPRSRSPPLVHRFIASRMKQSAHRLNCSFGILLWLLAAAVAVVLVNIFPLSILYVQNALVDYNALIHFCRTRAHANQTRQLRTGHSHKKATLHRCG